MSDDDPANSESFKQEPIPDPPLLTSLANTPNTAVHARTEHLWRRIGDCPCADEATNILAAINGYETGRILIAADSSCYTLLYAGHIVCTFPSYTELARDRHALLAGCASLYGPGAMWFEPPLEGTAKPGDSVKLGADVAVWFGVPASGGESALLLSPEVKFKEPQATPLVKTETVAKRERKVKPASMRGAVRRSARLRGKTSNDHDSDKKPARKLATSQDSIQTLYDHSTDTISAHDDPTTKPTTQLGCTLAPNQPLRPDSILCLAPAAFHILGITPATHAAHSSVDAHVPGERSPRICPVYELCVRIEGSAAAAADKQGWVLLPVAMLEGVATAHVATVVPALGCGVDRVLRAQLQQQQQQQKETVGSQRKRRGKVDVGSRRVQPARKAKRGGKTGKN